MTQHVNSLVKLRIYQSSQRTPPTKHETLPHTACIRRKHATNVVLTHILDVLVGAALEQLDQRHGFIVNDHWIAAIVHLTQQLLSHHATLGVVVERFDYFSVAPVARRIESSHEPARTNARHTNFSANILC